MAAPEIMLRADAVNVANIRTATSLIMLAVFLVISIILHEYKPCEVGDEGDNANPQGIFQNVPGQGD
jgi:hypothetical protein